MSRLVLILGAVATFGGCAPSGPAQAQPGAEEARSSDSLLASRQDATGAPDTAEPVPDAGDPVAVATETLFSYRLRRGIDNAPKEVRTEVENWGGRPLALVVKPSACACEKVRLDKDVLLPGEKTGVVISFQDGALEKDRSVWVELKTNDPETRELAFHLDVDWVEPVKVEPADGVLDFGELAASSEVVRKAGIAQEFGDPPLEVLDVRSSAETVTASIAEAHQGGKRAYEIGVALKAGSVGGLVDETVVVTTNQPDAQFLFHVAAFVNAGIDTSPRQVYFGRVSPRAERVRAVRLSGSDGQPIRLASVEVSCDALAVERVATEEGDELRVHYKAGADVTPSRESIVLAAEDGRRASIPVRIDAIVASPAPALADPRPPHLGN